MGVRAERRRRRSAARGPSLTCGRCSILSRSGADRSRMTSSTWAVVRIGSGPKPEQRKDPVARREAPPFQLASTRRSQHDLQRAAIVRIVKSSTAPRLSAARTISRAACLVTRSARPISENVGAPPVLSIAASSSERRSRCSAGSRRETARGAQAVSGLDDRVQEARSLEQLVTHRKLDRPPCDARDISLRGGSARATEPASSWPLRRSLALSSSRRLLCPAALHEPGSRGDVMWRCSPTGDRRRSGVAARRGPGSTAAQCVRAASRADWQSRWDV